MAADEAKQISAGRVGVLGLVKRFGSVPAVDGVTLSVAPGEFVALLGPSGSGKTTLLMAIAGFEFPDEGRVEIGDEDVTWSPPHRRNLGMVFQRYTLFPHMSVQDNVAFPLKMRGVGKTERRRRAVAALSSVRLAGYESRSPAQLSGGQQQRVAIARAIVYRPRVLLMDEPLSALDRNLREELQLEIKHLQKEIGITVVFVTHDQTEALTMADRVAVLDRGRLQQVGAPRDLYEAPATPFVAGFIGESNFLIGRALGEAVPGGRVKVALSAGDEVFATAVAPVRSGDAMKVAIRPERLTLSDAGEGLAGTVQESIYAGSVTTCVVALPGGEAVRAKITAGGRGYAPGEPVRIGWKHEDARCFGAAA